MSSVYFPTTSITCIIKSIQEINCCLNIVTVSNNWQVGKHFTQKNDVCAVQISLIVNDKPHHCIGLNFIGRDLAPQPTTLRYIMNWNKLPWN